MKKLLLIAFFLLVVTMGFAQEITADTPAVDMTTAQKVWAFIAAAFVTIAGFVGRMFSKNAAVIIPRLTEALAVFLKSWNHWRGSNVVIDRGVLVINRGGQSLAKKLEDGTITDKEKSDLIDEIAKDSTSALKELYGFYKKDLESWAQEQAGVFVGKFLLRGSKGSALKTAS